MISGVFFSANTSILNKDSLFNFVFFLSAVQFTNIAESDECRSGTISSKPSGSRNPREDSSMEGR